MLGFLSGSPLGNAAEPDAKQWTSVGDLHEARVAHTATLLPDGRVLITGGLGTGDELASTEIFEPDQGKFVPAADMHSGRTAHTATLLNNGLVLVVGGQYHGQTLAGAELFDPATGEWSKTGSLHLARSYHTATLLADGQVLVAGGTRMAAPADFPQGAPPGNALDVAELYNPSSGKWTVVENLHVARFCHTATLLKSGQVLVAGGIGAEGARSSLGSAELYHPDTQAWTATADLPHPVAYPTAALLPNGQVLVAGGKLTFNPDCPTDATELYNPASGTWSATGSLSTPLNGQTESSLPNGQVLIVGGSSDPNVITDVESYDPASGMWKKEPSLQKGRSLHTATVLPDGRVLAVAGLYANGAPFFCTPSAEIFGPVKPAPLAVDTKPVVPQTSLAAHSESDSIAPLLVRIASGSVILAASMVTLAACCVILASIACVFYLARNRP